MNGMPTNQGEERTAWLELARRQSQKLAEARVRHVPALKDWSARGNGSEPRRWRLSWALGLLPLLILGGATGTWAALAHLRAQGDPRPAAVGEPRVEPVGAAPRLAPAARRPAAQPQPVVEPAPLPAKQEKKARRKQKPSGKSVTEPPVATVPSVPSDRPQRVIFGSSSEPVIIVNPPARLGPLWTPEDYKRRGLKGSH